ncbi:MAG: TlpA family protein disulfide reductase [Aquisalinus sp.]|nr:TlpA family protein disulfide reductase [Aquisalinus sp.]
MQNSTDPSPKSFISQLFQPRMMLMIWGGVGALIVLWVSVSAMIPQGKPGQVTEIDRDLLVGEMADFELAFPPRGAPLTRFQGPEGETELAKFKGKTVLVNLWATWCPPCVDELPSLDALQAEIGSDDFVVVAIAAEPRMEERGPPFLARLGVENLGLYHDPRLEFVNTTLGANPTLPVSILYDSRGREVGRLNEGADWNSPEAQSLIKAVMDGEDIS